MFRDSTSVAYTAGIELLDDLKFVKSIIREVKKGLVIFQK